MIRKYFMAMVFALLAATSAFGGGTFYGELVAMAPGTGGGKVYAGNSNSMDGTYSDGSSSASQEGEVSSGSSADLNFFAFAKANAGYEFAGWSESDGGEIVSSDNPYMITVTAASKDSDSPTSKKIYANFTKLVLSEFTVSFVRDQVGGTYTVNGDGAIGSLTQTIPLDVSLVATPAANYAVKGWYTLEGGNKTYFATSATASETFAASTTVGVDFVPVVVATTYEELRDGLENGIEVSVASGAQVVIPQGETLVVAERCQLVVNGTLAVEGALYIDGKLSNAGTVTGAGTISKCTKVIRQTGGDGEPINPYDGDEKYRVKYWKTAISSSSSASVSGVSADSQHVRIINGYGETVYRGPLADAFVCTTDKSVAINHITGVKASYSSGTDAYNAVAKNKHNVSLTTCNLMSGAASEMVLLTANETVNVGSATALGSGFIADCAGYTLSFTSKQFNNAANVVVLNASTVTSSKLTNARLTAINCSTVTGAGTDGINNNQASYYTSLHLYDCSSFSNFKFSASAVMTVGTPGICFFSGGPYDPTFTGNYHVYGGIFSKDPTNYLASNDLVAPKEGGYWHVRRNVPTLYVAKVGATEYESLQEAIDAAASGGTVELLSGIETEDLAVPVTVPAGKTVTLDLAGYAVTAPNGAIVNHGTLYLQDTSAFDVPGSLTTANGNVIVNDGTLDVTYGAYTGNVALNGGVFTTHFGAFDGMLSVASGLDPKVVTNLRGGEFSNSVSSFLRDGYGEVYSRVSSAHPMRYWIVQPQTVVSPTTYSGAEKAWKLDFLSSSDLTLYRKTKNRIDHSTLLDWQRRAELYSYLQPYSPYIVDCALMFDRAVASESVTFYGKTVVGVSQSLDRDLEANEDYSVLARKIYEQGASPYTYSRAIDEIGSITAGIRNNSAVNNGTICTIDLRTSTQSGSVFKKRESLATVRYMIGGGKAAIDRAGGRAVYASLAAAVADAQSGETVLAGADTAENVTLTRAGTFTIDPYGFNCTGTVSIGEGLVLQSMTTVESAAVGQGVASAAATVYTVASVAARIGNAPYASLADAIAAAESGDTVTLLVDNAEAVTLPVGVTFSTNGKNFTGVVSAPVGYVVQNSEGVYTVLRDRLVAAAVPVEKVYDGVPATLSVSVWSASSGVPFTDNVVVTFFHDPSNPQNPGNISPDAAWDPDLSFTDATTGANTVWYIARVPGYDPVTNSSTVAIARRPVTVTAASAEKVYDGLPLTDGGYTVAEPTVTTGFVGDEGVSVIAMTDDSTITMPGRVANRIDSAKTVGAAGTKLSNYDITYADGWLTVTRRYREVEALVAEFSLAVNSNALETVRIWASDNVEAGDCFYICAAKTYEDAKAGNWVRLTNGSWDLGDLSFDADGFARCADIAFTPAETAENYRFFRPCVQTWEGDVFPSGKYVGVVEVEMEPYGETAAGVPFVRCLSGTAHPGLAAYARPDIPVTELVQTNTLRGSRFETSSDQLFLLSRGTDIAFDWYTLDTKGNWNGVPDGGRLPPDITAVTLPRGSALNIRRPGNRGRGVIRLHGQVDETQISWTIVAGGVTEMSSGVPGSLDLNDSVNGVHYTGCASITYMDEGDYTYVIDYGDPDNSGVKRWYRTRTVIKKGVRSTEIVAPPLIPPGRVFWFMDGTTENLATPAVDD